MKLFRSINEEIREGLSWDERWRGQDRGLITCWEVGRTISSDKPELAAKAIRGELPLLPWKGGVEKVTKNKEKHGSLLYLAQWQGMRGDNLDIDTEEEVEIVCSRTGMKVTFTKDLEKYINY